MKKTNALMKSAFLACLAVVGFASCEKEDEGYSAEQIAFFEKQRDYIREKKQEVDADGKLVYEQLVYLGDTVLMKVLEQPTEDDKVYSESTPIKMKLKGDFIDGKNFQKEGEMTFAPNQLIYGLRPVLLNSQTGGNYEAILPASLGYGYSDYNGIPGGSTLIFTFKVLEIAD